MSSFGQFPGPQGAPEDGTGVAVPPQQQQMGQPIETTGGQFQGGNMGPQTPTGTQSDGQKTTLW